MRLKETAEVRRNNARNFVHRRGWKVGSSNVNTRRFIFNFAVRTECPLGKWGRDCEMDCKCQNGAACDPFDGKCMCTRGWTGLYCDQKCLPNRYGQDCAEECRCRNGGRCHHISGECHCASGYTGPLWVFFLSLSDSKTLFLGEFIGIYRISYLHSHLISYSFFQIYQKDIYQKDMIRKNLEKNSLV